MNDSLKELNRMLLENENREKQLLHESSWQYDDGSQAVILWSDSMKKAVYGVVPVGKAKKTVVDALLKKHKLSKKEIERERLKPMVGHPYYHIKAKEYLDEGQIKESLNEIHKLLFSCGRERKNASEMLKIVLGLLSGYTVRFFTEHVKDDEIAMEDLRAPVILVDKHDGRWDALKKVIESVSVSPTQKHDKNATEWIEMIGPAVFNSTNRQARTMDFAYIFFNYQHSRSYWDNINTSPASRRKKLELPVQYRDSAVLLYRSQFEKNIKEFLLRNRWASVVLYGTRSNPISVDPIKVDTKKLHLCDLDWSSEKVRALIREFVAALSEMSYDKKELTKLLKNIWRQAKERVNKHNAVRGTLKVTGQQGIWMRLMMSSLLLFIHFLRYELSPMNYSEADRDADWWDAELTNLLLPGSCDVPPCSKPISERALDIARDADEILQEMLKNLISPAFSAHLCYVLPKGLFDLVDPEDDVTEYWGYLRKHLDKNRKPSYLALQIRKDKMVEIGKHLFPLGSDDWEKLLQRLKKKKPAYLCFIRPESMPIDETERVVKKTVTALTFDIEKFDFLSEESKKYLQNRFLGMEDQAAWANARETELKREAAAKNKATGLEADRIDETEDDLSTLAQL